MSKQVLFESSTMAAQQEEGVVAASPASVVSTPTKEEGRKLKLLSKQVLGMNQVEMDSGEFIAELMMMEHIITRVRINRSLVKDLWGKMEEKEAKKIATGAEGVEVFTCSTMKGVPQDWKFSWCVKNADFTSDELVVAISKDPEAVDKLMEYATQIGGHLKVPEGCKFEPVMQELCNSRHIVFGTKDGRFQGKRWFCWRWVIVFEKDELCANMG